MNKKSIYFFYSITLNERKPIQKKKKKINSRGTFIDDDGESLNYTKASNYLEIIVKRALETPEKKVGLLTTKAQKRMHVKRLETDHEKEVKRKEYKRKVFLEGKWSPPSKKKKEDAQPVTTKSNLDYFELKNKFQLKNEVISKQKLIKENIVNIYEKEERKQQVLYLNQKEIQKALGFPEVIEKKSETFKDLEQKEDKQSEHIIPLSVFSSLPFNQFIDLQDIRVKQILLDCTHSETLKAIEKVSNYVNEKNLVSHRNCKLAKLIKHTVKQKAIQSNINLLQATLFKKLEILYPPINMTNLCQLLKEISFSKVDKTCFKCIRNCIEYSDKTNIKTNNIDLPNINYCCNNILLPPKIEQDIGKDLLDICDICIMNCQIVPNTENQNDMTSVIECLSKERSFCNKIVVPSILKAKLILYISKIPDVDEEKVGLFSSQYVTSAFHSWKDQNNKRIEENKIAKLKTKRKSSKKEEEEKKVYWGRSKILIKLAKHKIMSNPHIYIRRWEKNPKGLGTRQSPTLTPFIIEGADNPPILLETNTAVSNVTILKGKEAKLANKIRSKFWEEIYKEKEKDDMKEKKKSIARKRRIRKKIPRIRQHSLYSNFFEREA